MKLTEGMQSSECLVLVALLCFAALALAMGERDICMVALGAAGIHGGGYALGRGIRKAGGGE